MSYERLTFKNKKGEWCVQRTRECDLSTLYSSNEVYYLGTPIDRLAELEDKLESGELVELPCIVNTSSPKYKVIVFRGKDGALHKTHSFEKSEAEARLKELQEAKK